MRKTILWMILLTMLLTLAPAASATETEAITPITTVEELKSMDPTGSYYLANDLDLTGVDWKPLNFSGSFDGRGHSILNLTLSHLTEDTATTWDGNWKEYDTHFSGLFGILTDAQIQNLHLVNVRGVVAGDGPTFVGGLAGYIKNTTISGCSVTGTLELRAHDRNFGLGGLVGHGRGTVENCQVDVTMICVDTEAKADEQFLGGIYAAGYINVTGCAVKIDGYVSEHGYTHNGGVTGMCCEYPLNTKEKVTVSNNSVTGKITFFEEVSSRRAYCKAIVGEVLASRLVMNGNTEDFTRDERNDYTRELRPETCAQPSYTEEVTVGRCTEFGYTTYTCAGCGYSYRDHYTFPGHTVTSWTVLTPATRESEGLEEGACDNCGVTKQRGIPVDTTPETEPPTEEATLAETQPETQETTQPSATEPETTLEKPDVKPLYIAIVAAAVLALVMIVLIARIKTSTPKGRYAKKRK